MRHATAALLVAHALAGCTRAGLDGEATPRTCENQHPIHVAQLIRNRLDLLFVVDNSGGSDAIADELDRRWPEIFKIFDDLAITGFMTDLHLGVVTSDYGAGATGAAGCDPSPGGQRGRLQAVGRGAPNSCKPPGQVPFIQYDYASPGKSNLPDGQGLADTFRCMAKGGAFGCGYEHPLESAYAALHGDIPENAGFLRDNALLAVVFVTNEDDCSGPPSSPLFDKSRPELGYQSSYRCTRHGIVCGNPPAPSPYGSSKGPLAACAPAPGSQLLYDVQRYIDFFTRPPPLGGVKANPRDVILVGLDGPETPFEVKVGSPAPPWLFEECAAVNELSSPPCVPVLQPSCQSRDQPLVYADPAVRLNTVIRAAQTHKLVSLCDADWRALLSPLASMIVSGLGGGCIPAYLTDLDHPDCVVEDETHDRDGTVTIREIPACAVASGYPCWRVEKVPQCAGASPQGVGVKVDRNGEYAPDNTVTRVWCAVEC